MNGLLVETAQPCDPFPIRIPSHHHCICILNFSAIQAKQAVTVNLVQNFLAFFLIGKFSKIFTPSKSRMLYHKNNSNFGLLMQRMQEFR